MKTHMPFEKVGLFGSAAPIDLYDLETGCDRNPSHDEYVNWACPFHCNSGAASHHMVFITAS
jgi:hypothetical protein